MSTAKINREIPFDTMGLFTFLRTYARRHDQNDPNSTVETWEETINRIVTSCNSQLKVGFTEMESQELYELLYNLKCSVAGRFLWQLGTSTVDRIGLPSLQNCSFVVVDEAIRPFTWAMDFLMLGSGVGYRILPEDVAKIPKINYALITRKDTNDADFIVPDSREGWVKLLGKTLKSHFYSGKGFTYSCLHLRSKGAPIKSFGGTASGPEVLCDGIDKISNLLNKRVGQRLRPIDALDIMNIIGMIVVAGNVRRSAQIAIGSIHDKEFLQAKRWDLGNIPNWRAYSNNSVICDDIETALKSEDFWMGYEGTGEPYGLINLKLARSCGRLGERQYPDPELQGFNPCAEQGLCSYETCCLAELFLPNINTKEELFKCATYLYRICKHSLTLPCGQSEETEKIVHRNMRMGIGVSGYLQATEDQRSWLSDCYKYLRNYDKQYSIKHGFPFSIKLTTVKPSGTLSILANCTPGIHPGFSRYYRRRVRIASESPLISVARKHGYHVEYVKGFDGRPDHTTQIVSFPMKLPSHTIFADQCSAIEQLEWVRKGQTEWSDNSVSVTVYYRKHELPAIKAWLKENYNSNVKTVSFLLHSDHGFAQAPMEQISETEYLDMVSNCKPIRDLEGVCYSHEDRQMMKDEKECAGGACPKL
jgi:adenosylcobalamin-dependent ribonucleoside-triphosphate reductase